MAALAEQIERARRAGYAPDEIAAFLAQQGLVDPAKIREAEQAGYGAEEVLGFLGRTEPPTFGDKAKRTAGLAARDVVMGAAGFPLPFGDAANALINLPIKGWNAATGQDVPRLGSASGAVEDALTRAGLPQPRARQEEVASGGMRVMSGTGGVTAGGGSMPPPDRHSGTRPRGRAQTLRTGPRHCPDATCRSTRSRSRRRCTDRPPCTPRATSRRHPARRAAAHGTSPSGSASDPSAMPLAWACTGPRC